MTEADELNRQANELYEAYGKALERDHWGEFIAISRRGAVVLGDSLLDVAQKASQTLGKGRFVFKIGERAVGKLRSPMRVASGETNH